MGQDRGVVKRAERGRFGGWKRRASPVPWLDEIGRLRASPSRGWASDEYQVQRAREAVGRGVAPGAAGHQPVAGGGRAIRRGGDRRVGPDGRRERWDTGDPPFDGPRGGGGPEVPSRRPPVSGTDLVS